MSNNKQLIIKPTGERSGRINDKRHGAEGELDDAAQIRYSEHAKYADLDPSELRKQVAERQGHYDELVGNIQDQLTTLVERVRNMGGVPSGARGRVLAVELEKSRQALYSETGDALLDFYKERAIKAEKELKDGKRHNKSLKAKLQGTANELVIYKAYAAEQGGKDKEIGRLQTEAERLNTRLEASLKREKAAKSKLEEATREHRRELQETTDGLTQQLLDKSDNFESERGVLQAAFDRRTEAKDRELEELRAQLATKSSDLESSQRSVQDLEGQVQELKESRSAWENERRALVTAKEEVEGQLGTSQEARQELARSLECMEDEFSHLEETLLPEAISQAVSRVATEKNAAISSLQRAKDRQAADLTSQKRAVASLSQQLQAQRTMTSQANAREQEKTEKLGSLGQQVTALQGQVETLQRENHTDGFLWQHYFNEWRHASNRADDFSQEVERLKVELDAANVTIGELNQNITDWSVYAGQLTSEVEGLNQRVAGLEGQISSDKSTLAGKNRTIQLNAENAGRARVEAEQLRATIQELNTTVSTQKKAIVEKDQKINSRNGELIEARVGMETALETVEIYEGLLARAEKKLTGARAAQR